MRGEGGARNGAKVTAALGLMVLVIAGCIYFYNVERNIHARETLGRSCDALETRYRGAFSGWSSLPPFLRDVIARDAVDGLREDCRAVDAHLDTWRWNIRRDVTLPENSARRERVARILGPLPSACTGVPREALVALHQMFADGAQSYSGEGAIPLAPGRESNGPAPASADLCASLGAALVRPSGPRARMSAWDWSSQLAALDAALSRMKAR